MNQSFGAECFSAQGFLDAAREWGGPDCRLVEDGGDIAVQSILPDMGLAVRGRAIGVDRWSISTWWCLPQGGNTELALEVLVNSSLPARRWTQQLSANPDGASREEIIQRHYATNAPITRKYELTAIHAWLAAADWAALCESIATSTYRGILAESIPDLDISYAQGAAPFQSEGTVFGYPYYFRCRNGYLALRVGGNDPSVDALWGAGETSEDEDLSHLTWPQFAQAFHRLVKQLKPTPFTYEFPVLRRPSAMEGHDDNSTDFHVSALGYSAEDALRHVRLSPLMPGNPEDYFISPTPVQEDTRSYPPVVPNFSGIPDLPRSHLDAARRKPRSR